MTNDTQFVLTHISTKHLGDDRTSESNITVEIYVGDGETISEKKILLWERAKEKAQTKFDINIDIITSK